MQLVFYPYLIFYACAVRFDVMKNLKKKFAIFFELNKALIS